jgi:serine/threonine protein phosphatase 1
MAGRIIAIGDIHGCFDALVALIDAIQPTPQDTLIPLGDYIDRGPASNQVLDRLIRLAKSCKLVPLLGNHEEMLLDALKDISHLRKWLECGGSTTLRSYGWAPGSTRRALKDWIPNAHLQFLANCLPFYETDSHIFVHGGVLPELPMNQQPREALLWKVTNAQTATPHDSGQTVVVGHTSQLSGEVLDLGFLINIDTNCHRGGYLTALDITTRQVWQANSEGKLRTK